MDTRREFRDIAARRVDRLFHHAQDVQTRTFSLVQRNLHDLFGDTFNFDIHLQRRDTVAGTRHFEVHIAQVIFVAQNVRQYNVVVAFFHQTHSDTCYGGFNWHASVHQRQRSAAHGSHRGRTVGFGDFRHHANGVREFIHVRHHCQHAALRQTTVTNFTTLRRTDHAGFAYGVRREVVVEQEAVSTLAHQFIKHLRVTGSTQSRGNQRLRFTTGKQSGTVSTRQYASAHVQTTDHVFFTAINTRLACQYAATHHVFLDGVQDFAQLVSIQSFIFCNKLLDGFGFDYVNLSIAFLFIGDAVRVAQTRFSKRSNTRVQRVVDGFRLPVPTRFTGFFHQIVDRLDNNLLLLVTEYHRAQHSVFAQQFSFGFHHQHSRFGTGNHQVQLAFFQLVLGRVQHVLVIDVTYARRADWAVERNAGQRQRSGCADHGNDVWVNLRVNGNDGRNNLHFVNEAFREQRTNRAVNQTRNQGFAFAWTAFTTEEAARDTTSSVGTLLIVNGQWEEVLAWLGFFLADNGNEYGGVIHAYHNSGSGLTRHHASFQRNGMLTVLEFTNDRIKQNNILSNF
ncbi:Uncharacterised protein [Salmonella enterica subsp. enterica serovar Bovismorbificans]|uniref:Uncharacterized protein n=1 Tax=Salmonella enterica subsp. enterica serovar Bovismorbificans TaxID=58097 RepID=A0A655ESJ2_SALET|nr:Uncharacterised protein [Salmonella enterica subsp. enterica serovar Bovismorbificans]